MAVAQVLDHVGEALNFLLLCLGHAILEQRGVITDPGIAGVGVGGLVEFVRRSFELFIPNVDEGKHAMSDGIVHRDIVFADGLFDEKLQVANGLIAVLRETRRDVGDRWPGRRRR